MLEHQELMFEGDPFLGDDIVTSAINDVSGPGDRWFLVRPLATDAEGVLHCERDFLVSVR